jgi:hypothetical protein
MGPPLGYRAFAPPWGPLPAGGGQAAALAKILDRWAEDHPEPYLGHHWPTT